MRHSIELYYQLRKVWIWTILAIVTIFGLSSLALNDANWYQARSTFDRHFDARHYYEIQDYANSLVGTEKAKKIVNNWQNKASYSNMEKFKGNSQSNQLYFYLSTINPDFNNSTNSYRKMIKILPKTFAGFKKEVLQYYGNQEGSSDNFLSGSVSVSGSDVTSIGRSSISNSVILPITGKSSKTAGPFNKDGFYTQTFTFNQSDGMSSVLLIILIGAVFFLIDQTHWINAYMLQRTKNGIQIALAKTFWLFCLPSVLAVFWAIFEYMTKNLLLPREFIKFHFSWLLQNEIIVLEFATILITVGLLIDSFIGTIFGKFYTLFSAWFGLILSAVVLTEIMRFLTYQYKWHFEIADNLRLFLSKLSLSPIYLSTLFFIISIPLFILAMYFYKHYSLESDTKYIRFPKLKKPFFIFVALLAFWDFALPIISSLFSPSYFFSITSNLSTTIWWIAWGIGITVFTWWLIFGKRFWFLKKRTR